VQDFPFAHDADACITHSQARHDASVAAVAGYCRQRTAAELVAELHGLAPRGGAVDTVGGTAAANAVGGGGVGGGGSAAATPQDPRQQQGLQRQLQEAVRHSS
jgi:hypothetical protein